MPRIRVRRELCDCLDCNEDTSRQVDPALCSALARLEPPPKSFIIILDGALIANASGATSLQLSQLPHLDALAREGCTGLLARVAEENTPSLASQILQGSAPHALPPLPQRFKNIQVALVGNNSSLISTIGTSTGCHSTRVLPLHEPQKWPQVEILAKELITSLGVQSLEEYVGSYSIGKPLEDAESDMIILWMQVPKQVVKEDHRSLNEKVNGKKENDEERDSSNRFDQACIALEWVDSLLRSLDSTLGFRDIVLTTVVVTPAAAPPRDNNGTLNGDNERDNDNESSDPGILKHPLAHEQIELDVRSVSGFEIEQKVVLHRPLQSYQFKGMKKVHVDAKRPAVVVHRLPGIVRKDRVQTFHVAEIEAKGGGGCILAERMLAEIAYKIDKAPKYGA